MSDAAAAALSPDIQVKTRERWVNGLIGAGHLLSHYYIYALPPLFPLLKAEFGVSYVELGLAMTAYNLLGGVLQAPVGFLVDRWGPTRVLLAGLALTAGAVMLMGFSGSYAILLLLALIAGIGNSVFHPADYAILAGSIGAERLGRAFSLHTFLGYAGSAIAPICMLALAGWGDWRMALGVSGAVGLMVMAVMAVRRGVMQGEPPKPAAGPQTPKSSGLAVVLSPAVLLFLAYFILFAMASSGLTSFTVSVLINRHGLDLGQANAALTGHLFGLTAGILLAGIVVDRTPRHLATAAFSLVFAAACLVLAANVSLGPWSAVALLTLAGVGMGGALPARDLMVREVAPAGETGKVFGFVFVGYAIGSSVSPVFNGWFLDNGHPTLVFWSAAGFVLAALFIMTLARRAGNRATA
jgi:FSR family fosmidomycin resistance protein-like MFS transporter